MAGAPSLVPGSLSPTAGTAAGGFEITVQATDVLSGAAIVVNGQPLATTITPGTGGVFTLTATAPAISGGAAQVTLTVNNPAPGQTSVTAADLGEASSGAAIKLGQPSPTPGSSQALIQATDPAPDPMTGQNVLGGGAGVMVELTQEVDSVRVRVYSAAYHLVGTYVSAPMGPGWVKVALPPQLGSAANGVYYYLVDATRNGGRLKPVMGKLFILN